jgi:hypothetical protein
MRPGTHRPAERGIEHPNRDLLVASDAGVHESAARNPLSRPLDHLTNAHRLPGPRMPSVGDHAILGERGAVGVLS